MMRLWRYLDRIPGGPHFGGVIFAGAVLAVILLIWVLA
jgi:hypothetical protein